MAGDWIKMRSNLRDDPRVVALARTLEEDRHTVVGRLHAFWSWADQHSSDGTLSRCDRDWVDEYVSRRGFGSALVSVGWLEERDDGLAIPEFEKHNGDSAKARAMASQRKRRQRSRGSVTKGAGQSSRSDRDEGVTREEKRREEEKKKKNKKKKGGSGATSQHPGPDDWRQGVPEELNKPDYLKAIEYWVKERARKHSKPADRYPAARSMSRSLGALLSLPHEQRLQALHRAADRLWKGIEPHYLHFNQDAAGGRQEPPRMPDEPLPKPEIKNVIRSELEDRHGLG